MSKKNTDLNIPINYTSFLILLCLRQPSHGYEIMKYVQNVTNGLITIGPATMYRSISDFLDKGYISLVAEKGTKKEYVLTEKGENLLKRQKEFLDLLHTISKNRGVNDEKN
ncbi:PadR family transcriptional regulator [Amphibacillus sp. Q70]|uniref:PadR family transcriptional regulator n=1 Tax=Amphibacillus sp. Q70 TaxID=3453416 RepID=UPI003F86EDBE